MQLKQLTIFVERWHMCQVRVFHCPVRLAVVQVTQAMLPSLQLCFYYCCPQLLLCCWAARSNEWKQINIVTIVILHYISLHTLTALNRGSKWLVGSVLKISNNVYSCIVFHFIRGGLQTDLFCSFASHSATNRSILVL